jgi:hypothetical protein
MIQKKEKIHTREILISTYEGSEDSIILEGTFKDERMFESHRLIGGKIPPGTVHHMAITMEIKSPRLSIEEIEVEMPTVPRDECRETVDCLDAVKGMCIAPGFTEKVKDLVGGVKGCSHLLELLIAMAPAAVHGAASALARKPFHPKARLLFIERLKNSCWLWREDGAFFKTIKDR